MMRTRPPDLTGQEVASSNTTLNAFLGGKAKSWMTSNPTTVRPTPRPAPSQRTQSSTSILPSPAPSNEPSPVQTYQKSPSNENRFAGVPSAQIPARAQISQLVKPYEQRSSGQVDPNSFVPASRSPTNQPSQTRPSLQDQPAQSLPQGPDPQVQPREVSSQSINIEDRSSSVTHQQVSVSSPRIQGRSPKRVRVNVNYSKSNPNHESLLAALSISGLRPQIPLIDEYIRQTGGADKLNHVLERPRFTLLRDACNNEDRFYIALHQLFCLWSLDRNKVLRINGMQQLGFGDFQGTAVGLQIVAQLIKENDLISAKHLRWFSTFPGPLEGLIAMSDLYRFAMGRVSNFLNRLAVDWQTLTKQCQHRGYPPLVDEMINRLGLDSPVLQGVFFTASRRNIGIKDDEIGRRMEKLFDQDREEQRELANRLNTAHPPTEIEIVDRNNKLVERYMHYRNQQRRRDSQRGNGMPSNTGGSSSSTSNLGINTYSGSYSHHNSVVQNATFNSYSPLQSPGNSERIQNLSPALQQAATMVSGSRPGPVPGQLYFNQLQQSSTVSIPQQLPMVSPAPQIFEQQVLGSNYPQNQQGMVMASPRISNPEPPLHTQQQQNQVLANQVSHQQFPRNHSNSQQQFIVQQSSLQFQLPSQQQIVQQTPPLLSGQQQSTPLQYAQTHLSQLQAAQLQAAQHQQSSHQMSASIASRRVFQHRQASAYPADHRFNITSTQGRSQNVLSRNNGTEVANAPSSRASSTHSPLIVSAPAVRAISQYRIQQRSPKILDKTCFIPELGYTIPPHAPNPDRMALHQAHLRSPILTTKNLPEADGKYYQVVQSYVLGPVALAPNLVLSKFEFIVSEESFARIAKDSRAGPEAPISRQIQQGSLQYRLRCVQMKRGEWECEINKSDWAVADCCWPLSICMEVNGISIETRRKNLHAKDLPVDITPHVVAMGPNTPNLVKIALPRPGKNHKDSYAIAVEVVEILEHKWILSKCLVEQRIPAERTLNAIKRSLSGLDGDDDEISMVVSDLTVDLADPWMSRIFEIPVRGSSCLHRECFDLETFLNTRISKPNRPLQPSMVDVWKCPLCGKDARPFSLKIDDFLMSVRKDLEKRDLLDTKAIVISADGTWVPKEEPQSRKRSRGNAGFGDDSDDDSEFERERKVSIVSGGRPPSKGLTSMNDIEVIELDDD